ERGAGELVAARLRHGGDDGARGAAVLRAVVLRDDAELLHGVLGEGIAAAGVLPDRAALQDVVLEADAVDEEVRLLGRLGVAGDGLPLGIGGEADARRELREV